MSGYQPEGYSTLNLGIIEVCEDSMGAYERHRSAFACDLCGALVVDTPRHNAWHRPAPVSSGEAGAGEAGIRAQLEALEARVAVAIEREKNTPRCPTCGSDGEPYEAKDGTPCPDGFHRPAPVVAASDTDQGGE